MEGTKFTDPELVAMAPALLEENTKLRAEVDRLTKSIETEITALQKRKVNWWRLWKAL